MSMDDNTEPLHPALQPDSKTVPSTPPELLQEMMAHPGNFSFFQTVSLLRRLDRIVTADADSEEDFLGKRLRVDGYLSLAFPPNDIAGVELERRADSGDGVWGAQYPSFSDDERIHLTATFMGLYGSASPLPTFYTEELLDDLREDQSATKSFFDMIGHLFFIRYYQTLSKYRLLDRVISEEDSQMDHRLHCLLGIGDHELLGGKTLVGRDLACTGLLSLRQRSSSGLISYLSVRLGMNREDIEVKECVLSKVSIPLEQRACLGRRAVTLGTDATLGVEIRDRMGSFGIELHSLDSDVYHHCLPWNEGWEEMRWAISNFVTDPLKFSVNLHLKRESVSQARLSGTAWRSLGGDVFLGSEYGGGTDCKGCRLHGST